MLIIDETYIEINHLDRKQICKDLQVMSDEELLLEYGTLIFDFEEESEYDDQSAMIHQIAMEATGTAVFDISESFDEEESNIGSGFRVGTLYYCNHLPDEI